MQVRNKKLADLYNFHKIALMFIAFIYFIDNPGLLFINLPFLVPAKADDRLVGNSGAMLKFKALSSVTIEDVELGVGDTDQSTAPKVEFTNYTNLLSGFIW